MRRAFVTGGSGFLGGRLIEMLVARGVQVVALARSDAAVVKVSSLGARPVSGDLADVDDFLPELREIDVVFHAAAHLRFWGPWGEFVAANVDATARLVHVAKQAGVRRFVHVSAASVVMRDRIPLIDVDETAPLTDLAHMPYSATKAMAERAALASNSSEMTIVTIRPPLVWGPGDTFDGELGAKIRAGQFAYFSGGRYPYTVCHVDNACHGAILAAERGRAGEAYFIADDEITEARAFFHDRIVAGGMKPPAISVPTGLAWILAGTMEGVWRGLRLGGEPPVTREVVRLMGAPFTTSQRKAATELGYVPIVSRSRGLAALKARQQQTCATSQPATVEADR